MSLTTENMTNFWKFVSGAALIIGIVALIVSGSSGNGTLAGITNYDQVDAADGFSVDETIVIDGTGNVDAPITSTTGTFSSTLAVTGASTLTGAVTGGSTISGGILLAASTTSAADVLTVAQSGQVIVIQTTGAAYTLPAVTNAGANYKFIVGQAFSTNAVVTSAEGDNIEGGLTVNSLAVPCVGEDAINFIAASEELGDWVEVMSDGTSWHIVGSDVVTTVSMTCTDP